MKNMETYPRGLHLYVLYYMEKFHLKKQSLHETPLC